ncbi:MAG: glycerol-3-phosphate dehydrogenase/oxidase [Acidobacteria bacterium]|nr:glycerol-3-phosphate dehydrogenase/oxidase [Acidobacteriota bacterium]
MSAFPADLRARSLDALRDALVDILIIGGGINGAGVARDLGQRRQQSGVSLQVALVEQRHFASGTSGRNSQLIHGGLRYLRYLKMGLVKESLRERAILRNLAPHLVEPLAFLMPIHGRLDKLKYLMGLRMYDRLAGDSNIARHREVGKAEFGQLEPNLSTEGLVGGAMFYDCIVHSARFLLENLFEAAANGVHVANYIRAEPVERLEEGAWRVKMEDVLTGARFETRARKIIDATGAWSHPEGAAPRLVRGSHLILPRLTSEDHAIAHFDEKGRIVFLIPWGSEKQLTLLGTTDVDHSGGPDDPRISKEEVDYLLGIARKLYPTAASFTPMGAFSSLRPLVTDATSDPSAASREYRIWNSKNGVLHIQGGKYTIYRLMSEEAVKLVLKEIAPWLSSHSRTASEPLGGNTPKTLGRLRADTAKLGAAHHVAPVDVERLIREYGVHTPDVLKLVPGEDYGSIRRLDCARIAFAVQSEMALRLTDVLYVSTYLGYERRWNAESLEHYARLMGSWLGWDSGREAREILLALQVTELPGAKR